MIADTFHLITKKQAYVIVVTSSGTNALYFIANTPNMAHDREFLYDDRVWRSNGITDPRVNAYYDSEEIATKFAIDCGCEIAGVIVV